MEISLSKLKWEVKGYWPYVPVKEKSMETGQTLHGVTPWIPAKVPGGVHYDLWKAGLIEHPYYGMNSLNCEWVENRWWMYRTEFPEDLDGVNLSGEKVTLICRGLDYEAEVFFNDERVGSRKGMYEPLEINLTGRIRSRNKLVVLFRGVPQEMGQIGYTSRTSTQKSRFNYKWDFSTRLVNIGFWQDVLLRTDREVCLKDCHIDTDYSMGKGKIYFKARLEDNREAGHGKLKIEARIKELGSQNSLDVKLLRGFGCDTGDTEEKKITEETRKIEADGVQVDEAFEIENPSLWYPNGYGSQPLYLLQVAVMDETGLLWEKEWRVGLRALEYAQNEGAVDALPYTFVINRKKIYIKGVNMTPLDHIYGNVSKAQYEHMVAAMVNAGVNLVRVWGGGLIETEEFYRLCDENGIMVWQEFIQSSSGIDNRPCQDEEFLGLLKKNAAAAVEEKRNHTSLVVYSGGNELMEKENTPCSAENKNLKMLQAVVERLDGRRMFLPTSASGPREFISGEKGVSHDVHGSWRYEGNPGHYELYGESDNLFHSEFGMDGTSSVKSLKKFLPEESLRPTPMSGDGNWQHHGEWWGTYFRDCEMFGEIPKDTAHLDEFVTCSQYLQAEGLRFIVEADRRRAFQNSGVIIWQLNEPWPNASCTNLMDYYGETKPAYYMVKKAFEPLHVSVDYRSLQVKKGKESVFPIYVSNSGTEGAVRIEAVARDSSGKVLTEKAMERSVPVGKSSLVTELSVEIPQEDGLYYITVSCGCKTGERTENTYLFSTLEKELLQPLKEMENEAAIVREEEENLGNGRFRKKVWITNTGSKMVVQAGIELEEDGYWMLGNDNYIVLAPGEERCLTFLLIPKQAGTFLDVENGGGERTCRLNWL